MSEEKRPDAKRRRKQRKPRSLGARIAGAFLYVVLVITVSAVLATVGWTWANDLLALNKEYSSALITIPEDSISTQEVTDEEGNTYTVQVADLDTIADQLEAEGLIDYKFLFKLYGWFSHADRKITPGTYSLDTEMDYRALVVNMGTSSATRQTVEVTIPEGYTLDQIFALLEENGVSTVEKLTDMAANWPYKWDFLQDIPLGDYRRLEGYIFPDTYQFYLGEDPKYVLNKMLLRFDELMSPYYEELAAEDSPYSLHEIVIMASLIEKETDGTDHTRISAVLRNRLENPGYETVGLLQIDACLVYINGGKAPTLADKEIDSPYNTYKYKGLPAGPISNPGMASFIAAMNPDQKYSGSNGYYYYALDPATNLHVFSKTLAQHQAVLAGFSND